MPCDAAPWPHSLRCATASSKGYCAVLSNGPVSPVPLNPPFAISPASQPVLESPIRRLPSLAATCGTAADGSATRVEARGDILMVLPWGIAIADVSVVHPLSTRLVHRAASTAGAAASHRDQQKRTTYARLAPNCYEFVPVSVESYGRLSQPAIKLVHTPGCRPWRRFAGLVDGALLELSVGLVRGNYFLYRASVGMLARSRGACFRPGLARPTDDCCAE
jgi:hypothetical protein